MQFHGSSTSGKSKQVPDNSRTDYWWVIDSGNRFCQFRHMNRKSLSGCLNWLVVKSSVSTFPNCNQPTKQWVIISNPVRSFRNDPGRKQASERTNQCGGTNTSKRSTSAHWPQNQSQRKTKMQSDPKPKKLHITIVMKGNGFHSQSLKPSRFFWRRVTLRPNFSSEFCSLVVVIGHVGLSRSQFWSNHQNYTLQLSWKGCLWNRFIWKFLDFSGELSLCVPIWRTSSCRSHLKTSKWFHLDLAPRRSLQ